MKTARKMLTLLMSVCCMLACVSANADTQLTPDSETTTATAQVVLDLGEQPTTYTVVIPSQITIDPSTGKGAATVTLQKGFVLTDITSLAVRMTDGYIQNSPSQNSRINLQNTANSSVLTCDIGDGTIDDEVNLISVTNKSDNSKDYSYTLDFSVSDLPPYGKYTGTLTFSIITA